MMVNLGHLSWVTGDTHRGTERLRNGEAGGHAGGHGFVTERLGIPTGARAGDHCK